MKKVMLTLALLLLLWLSTDVYAADAIKIQQNGVVKRAKEIGSGNGITFNLSDITDPNFVIERIEFAIFQKKASDSNYKLLGNTKTVENPTSLNITFDFGSLSKYQTGARYKIGYRYFVRSIHNASLSEIAGSNSKEGWRLVGEPSPTVATSNGFSFYLNSAPTISVSNITWNGEDMSGARTFTYTPAQLSGVYLPKNALQNGITVNYTVSDPDAEDTLTVYYKLVNKSNGAVIAESVLASDKKISNATTADNIDLILYAVDDWGGRADSPATLLKIDRQMPAVTSQFQDMGKAIRGRELYSKFTLTDDSSVALSGGNVYYSIKRNGTAIVGNTKFTNSAAGEYTVNRTNQDDGTYEITLTIFDKAYNKTIHTLGLTLDNTAPTLRFVPQSEDSRATLYNTWINYNRNIVIDVADNNGVKSIGCTENGGSVYTGSGIGTKVIAVPSKTGKLTFSITLEDTACGIDKTNNRVNSTSQGNMSTFSNNVWIDKTLPTAVINASENVWYSPTTVTVSFNDAESALGKGDNSGIALRQYEVGNTSVGTGNWSVYESGVSFNIGGIYYLHVKTTDNAGNTLVVSKKIKINIVSTVEGVTPTSDYLYTIYNSFDDIYIINNTAFNTKFQFDIRDTDINDTITAVIKLICEDDTSKYSIATVNIPPSGNVLRTVVFNMPYLSFDQSVLPDGVYTMELAVSEIKSDGDSITTHSNIRGCEVVIKRSSPPKPHIEYEGGVLTVNYPQETLSNSLNRSYIKALYRREYKIVIDGQPDTNLYKIYTGAVNEITNDCNVTALYTDPAGNISTATLRIFGSASNGGGNSENGSILKSGNTVTVEEGRPANIYFIGTRRNRNAGIDNDIFQFLK